MSSENRLENTVSRLKAFISEKGWRTSDEQPIEYGIRFIVSDGVNRASVSVYTSGKVLPQGKSSNLLSSLLEYAGVPAGRQAVVATKPTSMPGETLDLQGTPRIGTDESGKGDYFGPLVIGAVYVESGMEQQLMNIGVCDSKLLSDQRVTTLAGLIQRRCVCSVVVIGPKRYNELYEEIRNLNRILAWGHARALENVLERVKCDLAVADQFGDEAFLQAALLSRGRTVNLVQRPRAEQDIAVAAASVIARAEFLKRVQQASREVGIRLPKGASDPSIAQIGRQIVARSGIPGLSTVAKMHFSTTKAILGKTGQGDTGT